MTEQTPATGTAAAPGLDHVVVLVRDLDAAAADFRRLGFSPTPQGRHSIGTRNHCLMFGHDYLELLAVPTPHPVTAAFSAFLAEGEGVGGLAFATDDADAAWRGFVARGLAADAPVDFARPVDTPDGPRDARFRVVQLPVAATPGCRAFVCQHRTPELVWLAEYQRHPLGVTGIAGIDVEAPDPQAAAAAYGRVAGREPQRATDAEATWVVPLRDASIRIAAAAGGADRAARITTIRLRVAALAAAEAVLDRGGIAYRQDDDRSRSIPATAARGVELRLVG